MKDQFLLIVVMLCCVTPLRSQDWPGWRGADRTDVSHEKGLLKEWPEGGPKQLWTSKKCGVGYSGFAVVKDSLYTMGGYAESTKLICLNTETGDIRWRKDMSENVLENGWGDGPRGTPTVDGDFVYAMSGAGVLVCAKTSDGEIVWSASMRDFGGRTPNWGYTESVLVDGDQVICTPGGRDGAILALNKTNGEKIWQTKDFTDAADYSSLIVAVHNQQRQYIQLTQKSIVGVAANNGSVLWKSSWPGRTAVVPTPIFKDGLVYVSSGYGVGCKLVELGGKEPKEIYENKTMKNQHGGVILIENHLYGYSDNVGWLCQNFKTGDTVWSDRRSLGKGAVACADGMLYCISEDRGEVVLIEASTKGWSEKGRFTLDPESEYRPSRGKRWTHPTIANGKLYLRDQELVFCYDVKANK